MISEIKTSVEAIRGTSNSATNAWDQVGENGKLAQDGKQSHKDRDLHGGQMDVLSLESVVKLRTMTKGKLRVTMTKERW